MSDAASTLRPYRIDTHHHILPPIYVAQERDRIIAAAQGIPGEFLDWSPQKSLDEMHRNCVASAITSISTPGVWSGNIERDRRLARNCNEYGASMARDFPGRFGMFAAIPLPDIDGSLREIEYALDVLKLDGIGLMTNYDDKWPGDPVFAPVFDELNRRKSRVYFHPTAPGSCPALPNVSVALIEFPTETARAVVSLLFSGTFSRCPDLRFIFSHGGGTLPMLLSRINGTLHLPAMRHILARMPNGAMHEIQRLYYDTASAANAPAIAALRKFVPISQILFGSDFPYWPIELNWRSLSQLELSTEDLKAIERVNALGLFPRLSDG
jgi:predicted TIM-barrel fold metal-dependent hydrolase